MCSDKWLWLLAVACDNKLVFIAHAEQRLCWSSVATISLRENRFQVQIFYSAERHLGSCI